MPERESAFATLRAIPIRLPEFLEAMLLAGTAGYPPRRRRGLIIANVTGYLAAISSLTYAATYAAHDFAGLHPLVVGNVVSLRETLRWFDAMPLFGKRVLVTRAEQGASEMSALLVRRGARPIEAALGRVSRLRRSA